MARSGSQRLLKALSSILPIVLLIFLTGGPTAVAQFANSYSSAPSWLDQWFAPAQRQQPRAVRREYKRVYVPQRWTEPRKARTRPVQTATPDKPAVPPSFFVSVLGDSLGQLLGQGLTEAFADRPEVAISHKGLDSSGLVRDDFFNWPKTVHDLLAGDAKINVAVILLGSNDRQPLRVDNINYEPGSPKWVEVYSARIAEISQAFHDKNIPLVWVGLPIVKSERLSADYLTFNDLFKTQAEKAGATYVDVWEAFENDRGQYDPFGPDVNGQTVRIRTADGLNFTKAGARKLAHFVEGDIRRRLDASEPQVDPAVVTVPAETPAEAAIAPAAKPAAPAVPVPPVRPVAGPVLPLTGPVSAPGAQLATPVNAKASDSADVARALSEQNFAAPKPGRADNFVWPKP